MKRRRLRKPIRVALKVIACVAFVIGMLAMFAGAVLQESFKLYPPTAEELAENPELARYE